MLGDAFDEGITRRRATQGGSLVWPFVWQWPQPQALCYSVHSFKLFIGGRGGTSCFHRGH